MGVSYLKTYIKNNVKLEEEKWSKDSSKNDDKTDTGNIVLIVDGSNLFYKIGGELRFFFIDYKEVLEKYEEVNTIV